MKRILIIAAILISSLFAQQSTQKAVFDCASENMKFVKSRIWLIEESAKELKAKNIPYDFVLTIHSGCTPLVDKASGEALIDGIQKRLKTLHETYGLKIEACGIAVERFGYEKEDLLPYISTVKNSITRVIELQNSGYAFIPYH